MAENKECPACVRRKVGVPPGNSKCPICLKPKSYCSCKTTPKKAV